ncbi:MAG: coproporphyrinogen III oxidase, partial [Burkholderiaceae bacterium]
MDSAAVRTYLVKLQKTIVGRMEELDGKSFLRDEWTKPAGSLLSGQGVTRLLEGGYLLERGGVGFSHVTGTQLPPSATAQRPELAGRGFEAMGVSLVFHPQNPYVPTVHMNVRFFIARDPAGRDEDVWWMGGGMDLTPYYGFEEDARHFHATCRDALAPFGAAYHPRFKKECDDYFFLKHRNEARGVGGIFFDDFHELPFEQSFALMRSVGEKGRSAGRPGGARRREKRKEKKKKRKKKKKKGGKKGG